MGSLDFSLEVSVDYCGVELEAESGAFSPAPVSGVKTIGLMGFFPFFFSFLAPSLAFGFSFCFKWGAFCFFPLTTIEIDSQTLTKCLSQ